MSKEIQSTDGAALIAVQRRGDTGTLYADQAGPGQTVPADQLARMPVRGSTTDKACTCTMPTRRRNVAIATCAVCGGLLGKQ